MSVYLGYNEVTKQYLGSLGGGGGTITVSDSSGDLSASGFTMSGDINMSGNEVVGLDDPSSDSSAASKRYVDDEVAKITTSGGLDQATADNRYLQKTDASSTYETQTDASNTYLSKTDATNTYLSKASASVTYLRNSVFTNTMRTYMSSPDIVTNFLRKTDAANTYAPIGAAYAKAESDTRYARKGSGGGGGGLSASGFTMTGDIDMSGHNVTGLSDPTNDDMAASKGYVDGNFLDLAGGTMVGTINMGGYDISSLPDVPTTDNSATSKKYVDDEIKKVSSSGGGGASTSGFSMTGDINMQQNEITNLPDVPSRDHSAVSKKYMTDNFCNTSGDTMVGNLSMGGHDITNLPDVPTTDNSATSKKYVDATAGSGGLSAYGYEIIGVTSVPSFNNSLVNKKFVDDSIAAVSGGITQANTDARYVRKTKITLGEWMDTFDEVNFVDYNWSKHVKKSTLTTESNIEIRVAWFVTDMNISQLLKHKLIIGIRYAGSSSAISKHLITIPLSGKSFSKLSYGASGSSGDYGYMYSFHIHDEEYIGNDADAKGSSLWQVGDKFEATKSHTLLNTSAHISFALNEAGQYG